MLTCLLTICLQWDLTYPIVLAKCTGRSCWNDLPVSITGDHVIDTRDMPIWKCFVTVLENSKCSFFALINQQICKLSAVVCFVHRTIQLKQPPCCLIICIWQVKRIWKGRGDGYIPEPGGSCSHIYYSVDVEMRLESEREQCDTKFLDFAWHVPS